jgi:hypothetical protein
MAREVINVQTVGISKPINLLAPSMAFIIYLNNRDYMMKIAFES